MEYSKNLKTNSAVIIIILIVGAGYLLFGKSGLPGSADREMSGGDVDKKPMVSVVEKTPMSNGVLPAPKGLPQGIPLEGGKILESATTQYPGQNARQLSASYRSSKTVSQKYTEYKNYLLSAGYKITEGSLTAPVRAIFGTKADANLSVAISRSDGTTLVQLSYLLKSL